MVASNRDVGLLPPSYLGRPCRSVSIRTLILIASGGPYRRPIMSDLQSMPPRPSLTARKRNLGERVIEAGIFSVATLSIVFIFLILFYVLREASPIVFGSRDEVVQHPTSLDYRLPGDTIGLAAEQATLDSMAALRATEPESTARHDIVEKGYPVLERSTPVKMSYLIHTNWQPNSDHPKYGILPILVGTIKATLIALLLGAPLAILAAIYTAFFAPKRLREIIKPTIELLAGFPSVVIGFFCLMSVATVSQSLFGTTFRLNAVVGGIGLALAIIPIIYTITEDALRSVPQSLREAALAIGATEWQTAYQIMLPAATPGIVAAVLLGIGRAFGETMIALMAMGNAFSTSWNFFEPVRTIAATIGAEMGEVEHGSPHYQVLFFLGALLFVFSFTINLVTEFYVKDRLIKRFRGAE